MSVIVTMYMRPTCPFCRRAEQLLIERGCIELHKLRTDLDPALRAEMVARTGAKTVPQIFIGERHIGGCDQLIALDMTGGLVPLLYEGAALWNMT